MTTRLHALVITLLFAAPTLRAQQWIAPTPEELSMTSIPEVPGAPAVYLFKEETADDALHAQSFYVRLKVLTEGGKEYANVELPYYVGVAGAKIDDIAGRTIQPNGTIVPFTGKPYEKIVQKGVNNGQDYKVKVKVFSLPAVEIGSIIEYRYSLRTDDHYFNHPDWIIQTALYTRKAHYMWRPTDLMLTSEDGKQVSSTVAWTPILPPGAEVKQTAVQIKRGYDGGSLQLDLNVHDIPPVPKEAFMPPMQSLSYKVLFYYTSYKTAKDYWNAQGKQWSRARDKFIGPGSGVTEETRTLTAGVDSPEQKLRKIYADVMTFENTDFTREHDASEEKATGLKDMKSTDDVLARKRGNGDQLTELFVAMARAAGMKAYVMGVADRNRRFFIPGYLSLNQLDDLVAIVNVGGKEMYFDPGQRYCSFGRLTWRHALVGGLAQTDGLPQIISTPGPTYQDAHIKRVADLKLDERGVATGSVTLEYTGDSALVWRHDALRGDETSVRAALRRHLEQELPGGLEIRVETIDNLAQSELPLKVTYFVQGSVGSPTGKRLLVPANLFETNAKPRFPEPKRDLPIDMHYPSYIQDAVRLTLPDSLSIESVPVGTQAAISGTAAFSTKSETKPHSITLYRNFTMGRSLFESTAYDQLRGFYGKVEAGDQETLVLSRTGAPSAANAPAGGN